MQTVKSNSPAPFASHSPNVHRNAGVLDASSHIPSSPKMQQLLAAHELLHPKKSDLTRP